MENAMIRHPLTQPRNIGTGTTSLLNNHKHNGTPQSTESSNMRILAALRQQQLHLNDSETATSPANSLACSTPSDNKDLTSSSTPPAFPTMKYTVSPLNSASFQFNPEYSIQRAATAGAEDETKLETSTSPCFLEHFESLFLTPSPPPSAESPYAEIPRASTNSPTMLTNYVTHKATALNVANKNTPSQKHFDTASAEYDEDEDEDDLMFPFDLDEKPNKLSNKRA